MKIKTKRIEESCRNWEDRRVVNIYRKINKKTEIHTRNYQPFVLSSLFSGA